MPIEPIQKPSITNETEVEMEQTLLRSLAPTIQPNIPSASNAYDSIIQAIKEGQLSQDDIFSKCFRDLKAEMTKNLELKARFAQLEDTTQPQIQHIDQMTLLWSEAHRAHQTFELYGRPNPRLFIVLPQDCASWNTSDLFSNKFKLYFLCQHGDPTKSTANSNPLHHTHLAKHEGYDIVQPKELFQHYGSYLLTTLKLLRLGISMAGITVPTLSHLLHADAMDKCADLEKLMGGMGPIMDQLITHLQTTAPDKGNMLNGSTIHTGRDLETFLNIRSNKVLGDLYKIVPAKGRVQWVCKDHYRGIFPEKSSKSLCDAAKALGGTLDENRGHLEVKIRSRDQFDLFHLTMEKNKSIYELKVDLDWDTTQKDLKRLRDTLAKTNVSALELDLNYKGGPDSDILNHGKRHDPIFDIMRHPSIHSIAIAQPPREFIQHSSLLSSADDFLNLKYLEINLWALNSDIPGFKSLIARTPNLTHLVVHNADDHYLQVYNVIVEYQTYPITFTDRPLRILPPADEARQSMTAVHDLTQLLKVHGERIEMLELYGRDLEESIVDVFARAIENGSKLKELTLKKADRKLSNKCIKSLANIVARSELRKLEIDLENDEDRVSILEKVQWEHIQDLTLRMDERGLGMSPLKALVDGIENSLERVPMERFHLHYDPPRHTLPIAQEQLLKTLVASTSLKSLGLDVLMTVDQVLSLLDVINFSQLQKLILRTSGLYSTAVGSALDAIYHVTGLRLVVFLEADISEEQIEKMKARGTILKSTLN
ncbi:hypothetical protein BGX34_011587 [Mortierella sp. NVP85]|nr:hypothetical protein BGX34_011587 [Mortierella sp. NVP85]